MITPWRWTAGLALCAACSRPAFPTPPPCPGEAIVEALHAAAFHLEHGDAALGRAALARTSDAKPGNPGFDRMRAQLGAAATTTDGDARKRAAESVRAELSGWACLPEPLHTRFHTRLPALR